MKKLIFLLFAFACIVSHSQNQPAFVTGNYAGVSAVNTNPANIADNRYKIDIVVVGTSWSAYNNYIALKGNPLPFYFGDPFNDFESSDTSKNIWQDPEFQDKYLFERQDNRDKSIFAYGETMLPSALYTIDETQGVALTWRVRSNMNIDGLGPELANFIYNALDVPDLWGTIVNNPALSMQNMSWHEISAGYGRVMHDRDDHFIKVGGNLKYIQGFHAVYMYTEEFDYSVLNDDTLTIFETTIQYGRSESYDPTNSDFFDFPSFKFDSKPSVALDLGVVYEWRPDGDKYKYDMDGEFDKWMNDKNKYKFKAGLSLTDWGRLKFNKVESSGDFIANANLWDITDIDMDDLNDFDSVLNSKFERSPDDERTFTMQLPTALRLDLDYNVWNGFYVNVAPYVAFVRKNNANRVHGITSYSLTPRYENQWFGAYMPVSYNAYGNTAMGLTLRFGPVIFGTTDLIPYFSSVNIFGADGYFMLKVPMFRKGKPSDKDKDGVSDKKDQCPAVPGLWRHQGCPDTDNDDIADNVDDCPADSGLAEFNGCPDIDGDGIIDKFDDCPELAGEIAFKGCPDTDKDSIIDPEDKCPELAGLLAFEGCPDTDGDSIIDPEDLCPEYPGPLVNQGCPDRDGDGIFDFLDECPEQVGPEENNGCPWPDTDEDGILDRNDKCPLNPGPADNQGCPYTDTDGDGVFDKDDDCPNVVGPIENNGCPIIEEEEQEIINTAFDNLEFKSGKAIIRDESLSSLDDLAELLASKPDWKLRLAGHTDNVGNDKDNLILSKLRAEAVRDYLVKKGANKDVIKVEFYGEKEPIASNDTEDGRQKNRRVEMEIQFE